jgi:CheY-like chemotaxis protein
VASQDILLVEDDVDVRESICEALRDEGYSVVAAANGADALAQLEHHRDVPPGLILLDLMMPVMNGVEFLDRYAADPSLPDVPVVVMSANPAASGQLRTDVLLYLRKPIDLDRLLQTVAVWCG